MYTKVNVQIIWPNNNRRGRGCCEESDEEPATVLSDEEPATVLRDKEPATSLLPPHHIRRSNQTWQWHDFLSEYRRRGGDRQHVHYHSERAKCQTQIFTTDITSRLYYFVRQFAVTHSYLY